ncbi:Set1/Ash2 histone methyltransferase complex subunit ASH2 [Coelomomyces lativittatus]|nr:Set1/Ash2 histone methyltransferase complex subunit ASH2 [Coelomomyces lativittatus]KAJ1507969.1 Set1/Ash2 histone methyltransferase complex subunit ASH2 [Coelomomyces lativittatus]KAJ1512058.1 Set1/Ash2 histone methyltransferase complex subunit ASH2 [Coelomomyces lativittatus]
MSQSSKRNLTPQRVTSQLAIFPDLDNLDTEKCCISKESTHSSQKLHISSDLLTVTGEKGYRQAKTNHGVIEGNWYYEVELLEMEPPANTRIGWSQISGNLQAPCGFDCFSYGYRACPGTLFHESRKQPTNESLQEGYGAGDTLGVLISLPPLTDSLRQQLAARRWSPKSSSRYEKIMIPSPMEKVPGSFIQFFKQGEPLGEAFERLNLGMYFPSFSLYHTAKIKANFGPSWKFPPSTPITFEPMCKVREIKLFS